MSIYDKNLPYVEGQADSQELPFDCDACHRRFTVKELYDFTIPFANRGEQSGELECPKCGHKMKVQFAADSVQ